jgi:tetratricopeptide (TPR) repeat protein
MPKNRPAAETSRPRAEDVRALSPPSRWTRWGDVGLVLGFLGLTFALGAFPLRDTDFWWHLRTGDLIRQTWRIPRTDWYTYTVPDHPWIDLHWGFQVLLSWGYALGGVPALTLAKCAITTGAVALLISARKPAWPVWAMILAWLPALFVLGGRMYVRPETLSLFYLSIFLAVLFRWQEHPRLGFVLPFVELLWVNTQGLFVLGLIVLFFALIDAAVRPGAFAPERRPWWRTAALVSAATLFTCLLNPYGIVGALFPVQLAQTMRGSLYSESIAELTPIPTFIARHGLSSLPLQLHLTAMVFGGLSFLLPLVWRLAVQLRRAQRGPASNGAKPRKGKRKGDPKPSGWRLSPFRLLLFAAFSLFSLQATRNSHQFAAVVGTVTAWNLGEWAAAVARRRAERAQAASAPRSAAARFCTLAAMSLLIAVVLSGGFYALAGEGRTVGLGEEPLWFPHDAVHFAGRPGMPERCLGFHNGLPALYEYYFGPKRKVYADARLEVIGPELYEQYRALEGMITKDDAGWEQAILTDQGRPLIMVDNVQVGNSEVSATLFGKPNWHCVWFDPIAVVFLHESERARAGVAAVDFNARHFRPDPGSEPQGLPALLASARALKNLASSSLRRNPGPARRALVAPLIALGSDHSRRVLRTAPRSSDAWKRLGQMNALRDPLASPPASFEAWKLLGQMHVLRYPLIAARTVPRFRLPFDPFFDLPTIRATYCLKKALALYPDDFPTVFSLASLYYQREMNEEALPLLERLTVMSATNPTKQQIQAEAGDLLAALRQALGPPPSTAWKNLSELDQVANALLATGRAEAAANFLERAYPKAESRPWEITDRIATIRLHLGRPDLARALWSASTPPRPALRHARIGAAFLAEDDFDSARGAYKAALDAEPELFEALYGMAVLEYDAARPDQALAAARRAEKAAPSDLPRSTASALAASSAPFAGRQRKD